MIEINDIIELKGVTKNGKNEVNNHGAFWKVTMIRDTINFATKEIGPFRSLVSLKDDYWMWVGKDFNDFTIEGKK